jgi:hypothetical protein
VINSIHIYATFVHLICCSRKLAVAPDPYEFRGGQTFVVKQFSRTYTACFSTGFYRSPAKPLKNGFQAKAMEKPFCNLYYGGEAKNSGFPRLLPHM